MRPMRPMSRLKITHLPLFVGGWSEEVCFHEEVRGKMHWRTPRQARRSPRHYFSTNGWVLNGAAMVRMDSVKFRNSSSPLMREYIRGAWEPTVRMYSSTFRASSLK
jgi:hypothetical protein